MVCRFNTNVRTNVRTKYEYKYLNKYLYIRGWRGWVFEIVGGAQSVMICTQRCLEPNGYGRYDKGCVKLCTRVCIHIVDICTYHIARVCIHIVDICTRLIQPTGP